MAFADKSPHMQSFLNSVALDLYGISVSDALDKGVCVVCKHEALPKCTTELGRVEYYISAICEPCFDRITKEPDDLAPPL